MTINFVKKNSNFRLKFVTFLRIFSQMSMLQLFRLQGNDKKLTLFTRFVLSKSNVFKRMFEGKCCKFFF